MSLDMLHSQNQQYRALGRNDEISRATMKCMWARQVFPFISYSAPVLSALVRSGWMPLSGVLQKGTCSLLFFTQCCSQLCWAQSWAAELNAQCPSAGHRIFAPGSSHRDLHNPGHSSQGLSWQVLCEIEKRYYQCHGGPAQSLNKSNTSSSFLTAQSLHHSPLSRWGMESGATWQVF